MSDIIISSERPAYRVLARAGWYAPNDHLFIEGDVVYYDGEPNEEMEPLNQLARDNLLAFYEKVDAGAREAAAKLGRAYRPRVRLEDRLRMATQDSRRVELVKGDGGVPLMNGRTGNEAKVERIGGEEAPAMASMEPKRRGRPPKVASVSI